MFVIDDVAITAVDHEPVLGGSMAPQSECYFEVGTEAVSPFKDI